LSFIDHLIRDARHALRTISRMPLLAAVVVVSLGIGIGVNVVVFSWLQAVVLQPLPGVAHARQLVFVEPRSEAGTHPGVSWQEYEDLRDGLRTFDSLIASRMVPFNVGEPSRNERIYGQLVSGNYFSGLGLSPSAGRFFRADEVSRSADDFVMVVSHGLALSRFGSPAAAIGQSLRVNDRDVAIVGVAPEHFQGTVLSLDFSMWIPATLAPSLLAGSRELDSREVRGYAALGRLAAGATQAQAQADVENVMRELARLYPVSNGSMTGQVMSFWAAPRGPQSMITGALAALQGLMLLVLLAVCGNTANLMLARASTRQREVGVRVALGAGRARIVSVLLAENVLLALGGGLLGAALAAWGTNAIRAVPFIGSFPIRFQTQVDALGLGVAIALALACGVLVGLPPALQLAGIEPQRALRNGSRTMSRNRLRSLLMAAEVALALIVLLVGGLFYRGLTETREIDTGFRRAGVLLAAYDLTGRDTSNGAARDFAGRLLTRLGAMPGIESAAIATSVPLDIHGLPLRSFRIEGHARPDGQPERALSMTVSRGYFSTLGIPLVEGVDFADFAAPEDQAQVIVNEEFVRRFAAGGTPLGRRVQNGDRTYRICGVVRTTLYESFDEDPTPIVYFSFRDRPASAGEIHVRTREGAEMAIAADLRRAVREVDAALPLYDLRTMSEHVEKNLFLRRVPARMFAVLGPLLLVLAAIGIYAVVAYGVAQRTTEIGVRLALGASGARVVREVVFDTLRIVAAGAVFGWLAVYIVQIHIAPGRPLALTVFAGVPLMLLGVAFFASWLPAQRAARVDPMVALRHE
jgi:putative ABC transport system permease protein